MRQHFSGCLQFLCHTALENHSHKSFETKSYMVKIVNDYMKAKDWNVPRKKEISISEIDPFSVESVAPIFKKKLILPIFIKWKNNAVLALRPRKYMVDSRRLSAKNDRKASML